MKALDLFSGTKSIANAFLKRGHDAYSIEIDKRHADIDWYEDINNISADDIIHRFGRPDIIWASPPCTTYSIAAISHHRRKGYGGFLLPKSYEGIMADNLVRHTIKLINDLHPRFYFIENPRGGLRKMNFMQEMPRYTITYCQYQDKRMKPTDLWTNHPDPQFKPMCKKGGGCHEYAPRGSKTGTQGLKGSIDRSKIPPLLCDHIVTICENEINKGGTAKDENQIL